MAFNVTSKEEFQQKLKDAGSKLVLVDFYAKWCGPCKAIAPVVQEIAGKDDVVVLKVDVDENEEIAQECEISAMPTFVFYKNGTVVHRFSGASQDKLREKVDQYK